MSNNIQKQTESEADNEHRDELIAQIGKIRGKLKHFKGMQQQIEHIECMIRDKEQKISKSGRFEPTLPVRRVTNTNKKIKVYELRKKLEVRRKQYKDQHLAYMAKFNHNQELLKLVDYTDRAIKQERDQGEELVRLEKAINVDIYRIQQKCNQNLQLLRGEKEILHTYEKQKVKKIQQIKRLKKVINKGTQRTEPDDEDLNFSYESEGRPPQNQQSYSQTQRGSPKFLCKYSEEFLLDDQFQSNLDSGLINGNELSGFRQSYLEAKKQIVNVVSDSSTFKSSKGANLPLLQDELFQLQQTLDKDRKMCESIFKSIALVKKGNRNLEASSKHLNMTVQLLKNKLQHARKTYEQESKQLLDNVSKSQALYSKLRLKQGERGEIRGNLGIRVDNVRMLGIINQQISLDLQNLSSGVSLLKQYCKQCKQTVSRLISCNKIQ